MSHRKDQISQSQHFRDIRSDTVSIVKENDFQPDGVVVIGR